MRGTLDRWTPRIYVHANLFYYRVRAPWGLFGSGQLRRQIQSLADEMETIRRELVATKGDNTALTKQINEREEALKVSKESKKKLEKKLEKSNSARIAADKKANEHVSRLSELESEVQTYQSS